MSIQDQLENQKCHIETLPDELLSAVFSAGSASATLYDGFSFPMLVSTVSSLWRQIAINTPSLWSSVFVDFQKRNPFSCNIPLFIERSKMQPLSFNIYFSDPPFNSRSYRELSDAITENADRIREMFICVESLSDFHGFASPFNALSFPILTCLEIDSFASPCFSDHPRLFTGARHIRSMVFPKCLTCAPIGPDLTHLEIRNLTCNVEQLATVFQASPSLHTLTIYKFGVWQRADSLPIVAPSLHTLNLTTQDVHRTLFSDHPRCCPLSHLVTPNLINLAVRSFDGVFSFSAHFSTLPKIEKLKISGLTLTQEDASWIQNWSTLTHIELIDTDHTCLWNNSEANSSSDPWRNLTTVTMDQPSLGREQMMEAIRRSYTQSPRTITFNVVDWENEDLEEFQSELPKAVWNFIAPEFEPFIQYDTPDSDDGTYPTDNEDYDIWSDGSENYFPGIDYELDAELDPYYYDDDSFDEDLDEEDEHD